jgi:hypothetical protein
VSVVHAVSSVFRVEGRHLGRLSLGRVWDAVHQLESARLTASVVRVGEEDYIEFLDALRCTASFDCDVVAPGVIQWCGLRVVREYARSTGDWVVETETAATYLSVEPPR